MTSNLTFHHQYRLPGPLLHRNYFFHDVLIRCSTNHPAILTLLDEMLGFFSEPAQLRGEVSYTIACYEDAAQFPLPVPLHQKHTETIRLVTNTKLRYYVSDDYSVEYHSYAALPAMNAPALSVLQPADCTALTQLEAPEKYQPIFLRRCVLLIALGRLMHQFQYEPCHAAAVTAPWDNQQGALIFGSSGSGKTTLSLGCALQGCGLLGDDLVMLREDASGVGVSVFALQAEVSMRAGTLDLLSPLASLQNLPEDFRGKRHCSIEQVRAGAFRQQAPVRLLLFPTLVAAQENAVTRLSRARTLQELVDRCMRVEKTYPQSQEPLFSLLGKLAEQAPAYRLSIAQNSRAAPQLVESLFAAFH